MVKTIAKRKSESALPAGRSKKRKISARDDTDSARPDGESSDRFFVDEQPVSTKHLKKSTFRARKSEPVVQLTGDDEYEVDEGRMESQQFLALIEFESKKKKRAAKAATEYMGNFNNSLRSDEEALKSHLQSLSTAATKLDNDFMESFTKAYAASRPQAPPEGTKTDNIYFASLYDRSCQLTAMALKIVEMFEKASEQTSNAKSSILMDKNWEEENKTVAKLLEIGLAVGIQRFEALTLGAAVPEVDADDVDFAEAIYKPEDQMDSYGWGKMAKKNFRAQKKVVKTFTVRASA